MRSEHHTLINFVLSESEKQPAPKRAVLLRALADFCGNEGESKRLRRIAADIAAADQNFRQFKFSFAKKVKKETL